MTKLTNDVTRERKGEMVLLRHRHITDETWSFTPIKSGKHDVKFTLYEVACGSYALGRATSETEALNKVLNDMHQRLRASGQIEGGVLLTPNSNGASFTTPNGQRFEVSLTGNRLEVRCHQGRLMVRPDCANVVYVEEQF